MQQSCVLAARFHREKSTAGCCKTHLQRDMSRTARRLPVQEARCLPRLLILYSVHACMRNMCW
jgi:hypothetical protein